MSPDLEENSMYNDGSDDHKAINDLKPLIAGILLIIAGILAIFMWLVVFSFDFSLIDLSMFETQNQSITIEQLESIMSICATIGTILSFFPLLGGILSIQKKFWGGTLACSIIGLFIIGPLFLSSILCFISIILLIMSKKQFYQNTEKF